MSLHVKEKAFMSKKYSTVIASFVIMLCIGSVYAWSLVASQLMGKYDFSAFESQLVFGFIIAIFPVTMIFVGQLGKRMGHRYFGYICGLLFAFGYWIAGSSDGNFFMILLGVGIFSGVGTGFGYWVSLTSPLQWFPERKGLIAGIAAAGFGLGAVFMSELLEILLSRGFGILELLKIIGVAYGVVIVVFSTLIFQAQSQEGEDVAHIKLSAFIGSKIFKKLCAGIFLGTFAGLLIIGSLGIIANQHGIPSGIVAIGVALFAVANFMGRLLWGVFSDYFGADLSIFLALLFQSIAILALNLFALTHLLYLAIAACIGFGFGGNFVLFARETAQLYGVENLGIVYPYVFLGYAIAGIAGPMSGGYLYDVFGSFFYAILLASFMSFMGGLLFLQTGKAFKAQKSARK